MPIIAAHGLLLECALDKLAIPCFHISLEQVWSGRVNTRQRIGEFRHPLGADY